MKKYLFLLGVLLIAATAGASDFTNGFRIGKAGSGGLVGGWYMSDSTGRYLRFDSNGYLYTNEADKDRDYYALSSVMSNATINAHGARQTGFFPAEKYSTFQVHVRWSAPDSAYRDSMALLLVPFGKTSSTDDGLNFLINMGRPAAADSLLKANRIIPGILLTTTRNPMATAVAPAGTGYFVPGMYFSRIITADFGSVWNNTGVKDTVATGFRAMEGSPLTRYVSFTLGDPAWGGGIREKYIGFYVFNLSGLRAVSGLTIEIWPKVN